MAAVEEAASGRTKVAVNVVVNDDDDDDNNKKVALVAGATGLVGRELVKSLLRKPHDWAAVYGVARRSCDDDDDLVVESLCNSSTSSRYYRLVLCDLLERGETMEKLSPLSGSVTHLFWTTWASQSPLDTPECCRHNRAMLSNALDALLHHSFSPLRHVAIQTGTSHYASGSAGSGSFFHEDGPRVSSNANNFYYALEDLARERLTPRGVGWSVHRPGLLLGSSRSSHFNFMGTLAVYAAICAHLHLPFTFYGHRSCWVEPYIDASDARLVAGQQIWWACACDRSASDGQAFNAVNDVSFTWEEVWPLLASALGLPPPHGDCFFSETQTYADAMADMGAVWEEIVAKEGLRPTRMEDLANWGFLDTTLRFPGKLLVSRSKARRMGFTTTTPGDGDGDGEVIRSLLYWVDRMREDRLIP